MEKRTLLRVAIASVVSHATATDTRHAIAAEKRTTWTMFADVATTTIVNLVQNAGDTENATIATNGITTLQR